MISADLAWSRLSPWVHQVAAQLAAEPQSIARREARGRVIADRLHATTDVPALDVSAMDGFALGSGTVEPGGLDDDTGLTWPVCGTIAAGDPPGPPLAAGSAVAIMTGAPVPAGTDRIVPVELAVGGFAAAASGAITFTRVTAPGAHIRRQGEICRRGDVLLAAGGILGPAALALLASQGIARVTVARAPRVAILTTGDEVVDADRNPAPGQLRDSHSDFLLASCAELGLTASALGVARDEPHALTEALAAGLADAEVMLVTGGVSMGERDLVAGILGELGVERLFAGVAIQPGKPLFAGRLTRPDGSKALVFGLPGNPGSVMTCFWLLVKPALRQLLGHADGYWQHPLGAELAAATPAAPLDRDRFIPAILGHHGGHRGATLIATPLGVAGSHDLANFARANALLRLTAGTPALPPGTLVSVLPLEESRGD